VGATGFTTPDEVRSTWALLAPWPARAQRTPAFGVYTTYRTVHGIAPRHDDWEGRQPARYPRIENVRAIFDAMPRPVVRVLSYVFENDRETFESELRELFSTTGVIPDAVQVNQLVAPPVDQVVSAMRFMRRHGSPGELVWQLPPSWLDSANLIGRLRPYVEAGATRLLFDRSCGSGEAIRSQELTRIVGQLRDAFPHADIGVAGGLCADTLDALPELGPVSYDASSRLRDPRTDALDPERVAAYMRRARD
jgi:hypothetical protein